MLDLGWPTVCPLRQTISSAAGDDFGRMQTAHSKVERRYGDSPYRGPTICCRPLRSSLTGSENGRTRSYDRERPLQSGVAGVAGDACRTACPQRAKRIACSFRLPMDSPQSSADSVFARSAWPELTALFDRYRDRLRLMVHLRLDRRLQARVDSSDVIQEAFLEAAQRYEQFKTKPTMPPFLWLRFLVGQRLTMMLRRHLGAKARTAVREVSLFHGALPQANSESLAAQLLGRLTSPSHVAMRSELQVRVQEALNSMAEIDREVLVLRHFEQLSNVEAAEILGLSQQAASKRYVVALRRLKETLGAMPGFLNGETAEGRQELRG